MADERTLAPAPGVPDVDENGVDLAQVRAMLDRKPGERLSFVTTFMNSLVAIRVRNGIRGPD